MNSCQVFKFKEDCREIAKEAQLKGQPQEFRRDCSPHPQSQSKNKKPNGEGQRNESLQV